VSDIILPELMPAITSLAASKVRIRLGKVPAGIAAPGEKTATHQVAKGQFLFPVQGVACYYVANGNSIVVEPVEGAQEYDVRLFLLGTSFGALLMQRGLLPLHGSAVVIDGRAVVFTGVSGAGKSSLLAAFRKRGYPFLTDDVVAVTVNPDGSARVHPSYPQQKLWRDSTEAIGVETSSLTPFDTRDDQEKFAVQAMQGFWPSPVPLASVYEVQVTRRRGITLRSLAGMDKLAVLLNHTYRACLVDGLGLKAAHFKQCVAVARQVAVARLTRPQNLFSLEEQVRRIEEDLAQQFVDKEVDAI